MDTVSISFTQEELIYMREAISLCHIEHIAGDNWNAQAEDVHQSAMRKLNEPLEGENSLWK